MSASLALFVTYSTLTAPGTVDALETQRGHTFNTKNYVLFVTVATINTNVVVALEGSIDGTNYSKIIANQTITADGTFHYSIADNPVKYIRPVFVSESGGTTATVLFSVSAN